MIDYKDLAIGNYVKIYNGYIYQVESIHYDCIGLVNSDNSIDKIMCDRIYPIEVTEELLKKIGFEKIHISPTVEDLCYSTCVNEIDTVVLVYEDVCVCAFRNLEGALLGHFRFKYLHELQNGIRLITRNSLEVNL